MRTALLVPIGIHHWPDMWSASVVFTNDSPTAKRDENTELMREDLQLAT